MNQLFSSLRNLSLLSLSFILWQGLAEHPPDASADPLRETVLRILDTKCNSCHRRQNPFMVFRPNNLEKRADRIYRAVFVQRRMPKAGGEPLTQAEADSLRQWLLTKVD